MQQSDRCGALPVEGSDIDGNLSCTKPCHHLKWLCRDNPERHMLGSGSILLAPYSVCPFLLWKACRRLPSGLSCCRYCFHLHGEKQRIRVGVGRLSWWNLWCLCDVNSGFGVWKFSSFLDFMTTSMKRVFQNKNKQKIGEEVFVLRRCTDHWVLVVRSKHLNREEYICGPLSFKLINDWSLLHWFATSIWHDFD